MGDDFAPGKARVRAARAPAKGKAADEPQTLLAVAFPLAFRYVNRQRQVHDVEAAVVRVEFSRTDAGAPRITLWARDMAEASRGPLKSYFLHRFADITDPTTGEVLDDPIAAFSQILTRLGGSQPPDWPLVRLRRKNAVAFTGPGETAEGWAFHVPAAFRAALDILWTQETKRQKQPDGSKSVTITWEGWTEGAPPALSFSAGDVFTAPATVSRTRWQQQLRRMTHLIQIKAARPCASDDPADPGEVTLTLTEAHNGTLGTPQEIVLTQVALRELLRDGPQAIDRKTATPLQERANA